MDKEVVMVTLSHHFRHLMNGSEVIQFLTLSIYLALKKPLFSKKCLEAPYTFMPLLG